MKYTFIALLAFTVIACEPKQETQENSNSDSSETSIQEGWAYFGDTINDKNIVSANEMMVLVDESGTGNVKIEGTIEECCQKKGCWMKVKVEGMDDPIRVTFKDYGFFVPLNSAGTTVVMEGIAKFDTVQVDVLKHYAEDAGQSQEEIDAISEPEIKLAFEAKGVMIKEKI